jgi:hypothetical protein
MPIPPSSVPGFYDADYLRTFTSWEDFVKAFQVPIHIQPIIINFGLQQDIQFHVLQL